MFDAYRNLDPSEIVLPTRKAYQPPPQQHVAAIVTQEPPVKRPPGRPVGSGNKPKPEKQLNAQRGRKRLSPETGLRRLSLDIPIDAWVTLREMARDTDQRMKNILTNIVVEAMEARREANTPVVTTPIVCGVGRPWDASQSSASL